MPSVTCENLWLGEKEPKKGFSGGSRKGTTLGLGSLCWPPCGEWGVSSVLEEGVRESSREIL